VGRIGGVMVNEATADSPIRARPGEAPAAARSHRTRDFRRRESKRLRGLNAIRAGGGCYREVEQSHGSARRTMQPQCAVITVPTAGVPVQLPAAPGGVEALLIKGLAANLGGTVYVGRASNFNKTTGVNLITDLNGADATFTLAAKEARNRIYLEQYWVDVATSGDKVLITWWVA
jgi:hypothetical protein